MEKMSITALNCNDAIEGDADITLKINGPFFLYRRHRKEAVVLSFLAVYTVRAATVNHREPRIFRFINKRYHEGSERFSSSSQKSTSSTFL